MLKTTATVMIQAQVFIIFPFTTFKRVFSPLTEIKLVQYFPMSSQNVSQILFNIWKQSIIHSSFLGSTAVFFWFFSWISPYDIMLTSFLFLPSRVAHAVDISMISNKTFIMFVDLKKKRLPDSFVTT